MSEQMQLNLIQTYLLVCDMFDKNPQWNYIRLSNNNQPTDFTDQEAVTLYLFVGRYQRYSKISDIHAFAYQKFNHRLNVIYPIFYDIVLDIISNNITFDAQQKTLSKYQTFKMLQKYALLTDCGCIALENSLSH